MSSPLIVDISSTYSKDKKIKSLLNLANTIMRSNDLSGVIPVVTGNDQGAVHLATQEINDAGMEPIIIKGSLAAYIDQFPETSHVISEDPFVLSKFSQQTYWDIGDVKSYTKQDLESMVGFPLEAMGVYSILRGTSYYDMPPIERVRQSEAIGIASKFTSVNALFKSLDSDNGLPSSIIKNSDEIKSRIRAASQFFPRELTSINPDEYLQTPDVVATSDIGDGIVSIKSTGDLASLFEGVSRANELFIDYDKSRLLIDADGSKFNVIISDAIQIDNVLGLLKGPLTDSEKKIFMFDSREFQKQLMSIGIENLYIDDIATLAYVCNNLDKDPQIEVVSQTYLGEDMPFDNSIESQFEKLSTLKRLKDAISSNMPESQYKYYEKIDLPLIKIVGAMELNGIALDVPKLVELENKFKSMLEHCENYIHDTIGQRYDLTNRKHIEEILYDRLGMKLSKGRSTSAEALSQLAKDYPDKKPILNAISSAVRQKTMLEKYTQKYEQHIDPTTGLIHSNIHTRSTKTGRLSSSDPNLMGLPKKSKEGKRVKSCFIAPDSLVIVKADYSQIELKILAHASKEPALVDGFNKGLDVHRATAAVVFEKAYDDVTDEERSASKAINYGLIYGMQKYSLASEIGKTPDEAQKFIDLYFEKMPRVKAYLDWVKDGAKRNGYIKTLLGRQINIENIQSEDKHKVRTAERQATNAPMQGSAADIIKKAMVDLENNRIQENLPFKHALQVHDEIILYCKPEDVEVTRDALKQAMENAVKLSVPINVDVEMGYNLAAKSFVEVDYEQEMRA